MSWNPFNPASPFRSKRVQGAAVVLGATVAQVLGYPLPEEGLLSLIDQIGILWAIFGTITAKNSARPF